MWSIPSHMPPACVSMYVAICVYRDTWDGSSKCLQWVWIFSMGHKHFVAWRLANYFYSSVQLALHSDVEINLWHHYKCVCHLVWYNSAIVYVVTIVDTATLRSDSVFVM